MKKMLAIISTISLGAPMGVLGTSAAVNSLTNIQDAEGDALIDPIVPYVKDYKNHVADFGHEYKYDVVDPNKNTTDTFTSYASNSYALNQDQKNTIMRTVKNNDNDGNGIEGTQKNLSPIDTNLTSFSSGGKTFVGWSGAGNSGGDSNTSQLAWVDRDSQAKMTFRDTGIFTNNEDARKKYTQFFTPSEFQDRENNNHNGIFFASSDDANLTVNYYNLDFDKDGKNSSIDNWKNSNDDSLFEKTTWNKEDLGVSGMEYAGIMPIVALPEIVSSKDMLINRILIGFIGKDHKSINYYGYDITIDNKGKIDKPKIKVKDNNPVVYKINILPGDGVGGTTAETVYSLFTPTKDGDIINKSGSGDSARYFFASYFFDDQIDDSLKSFGGSELVDGFTHAGVPFDSDYDVDNIMWTPGDRHIIFSVYVDGSTIGSLAARHRFYSIDLQYVARNHVSKVQYLFSTAPNNEDSNNGSDYHFRAGVEKAIVGRVTKPSGSGSVLDYNFIATNSTGSRTIIYKYRYDSQGTAFGKPVTYDHDGDYTKNPVVETFFQVAGWNDKTEFYQLHKVMFINNEFVEAINSRTAQSKDYDYIVEVSQKIIASEMNDIMQSTTIELTQNTFDVIDTAFPDFERNNKTVKIAFLDAMIKGEFVYNDSTTVLGDSNRVGKVIVHKIDDSSNPTSLMGKWSTNNNIAIKIIGMSLQKVGYQVDGKIINDVKNPNLIISTTEEDLNQMLRVNNFGVSDVEKNLIIKEGNNNSILKGETTIRANSRNINNRFDLMRLNLELNKLIKNDFADYQITGYNTANEIVGYVLNKINNVIYDEKLKYVGDKSIPKILSDFSINKAISKNTRSSNLHDSVHDAWRMYRGQGDNQVYNDFFDGTRPFVLTKNFDNMSDVKTPWSSEASLRDAMGWGFQEDDNLETLNNNSKDGLSIVNLSNIVITINDSNNLSLLRSQANMMINKGGDGSAFDDGIMNYNGNSIELNKALLNIGNESKTSDGKYVGNHLTAKLNTNSLDKLYNEANDPTDNSVFDDSASKNLDIAVNKIKNYTINVDSNSVDKKTSIYYYFEKLKKELDLSQDVQITLWPDENANDFYVKPGDYKLEIVVYDALFFNDAIFFDKKNDIPTNNFYQTGNYRILSVSINNSTKSKKNTKKIWIIIGSTMGSLLLLLLIGGVIWIILYKKKKKKKE